MLEPGQIVAEKYRILRKVGEGGMSIVYDAINERANKHWAVKEIKQESLRESEVTRYNLIAERDILRRLSHPSLPSIVDIVDEDGFFIIVMDYVEGVSLSMLLGEEGPQSQEQVVGWALQICNVLEYLHNQNPPIIYRDLKPGNIMLRPDGTVCIIDFGAAREYKAGRIDDTIALGSKGYAAPEQFGVHQTDARTDIYNLGTTLYHLVTGHNPAEPPYEISPIREIDSSLSSGLEGIIRKCTQQNPDERYQNAGELTADLKRYRDLDTEVLRRRRRLKRQMIAVAAVATVLFVAAGILQFAEGSLNAQSYSSLISRGQANYVRDSQTSASDFFAAIEQAPERPEAYEAFLDTIYAQDNSISEDEITWMQSSLNGSGNKVTTNSDIFATDNPARASNFFYELGVACFFYLDNGEVTTRARNLALPYLQRAANLQSLVADRQHVTDALLLLAQNSDSIFDSPGKAALAAQIGSGAITPGDLWTNLEVLTDETTLGQVGNTYIQLVMYRYVLNTITERYVSYSQYGISLDTQKDLIDQVVQGLQDLDITSESERQLRADLLDSSDIVINLINIAESNGITGIAESNGITGMAENSGGAGA
ncbi:MAG: serine/threonine protein kinase [Coriobacteriales bacterium]|jgi:serine/threonine-protein kinase|nr:serine/threonine protein kinase [Coriobacteriales bacterium]